MALSIGIAVLISHKRYSKKNNGSSLVIDIFLPVVIAGIVGARVYHLFTGYDWDEEGITGTIMLRNGGLSIWGAVLGGALMVAFICRRKKLSFLALGDSIAVALLVAQAIGRFGNYFNQELFGKGFDAFWALEVDPIYRPTGFENIKTYHPTFLYEAIWCLMLAVSIIVLERKISNWTKGASLATYICGYCLGRTFFEYLRIDDATKLFGIRLNLMFSATLCLLGLTWLIKLLLTSKRNLSISKTPALEGEKSR